MIVPTLALPPATPSTDQVAPPLPGPWAVNWAVRVNVSTAVPGETVKAVDAVATFE